MSHAQGITYEWPMNADCNPHCRSPKIGVEEKHIKVGVLPLELRPLIPSAKQRRRYKGETSTRCAALSPRRQG